MGAFPGGAVAVGWIRVLWRARTEPCCGNGAGGAVGRRRAGWTSASDSRTEVRYVLTASRYLSTVA